MNTREGLPRQGRQLLCVYCLKLKESEDHTPPKKLLRAPLPSNAFTVPSCRKCNTGFSRDEEAIRSFLAVVAHHPDLKPGTKEGDSARRGIERNQRLRELMEAQRSGAVFKLTQEMLDAFSKVMRKTALGLYWMQYKKIHPLADFRLLSIEDSRTTTVDAVVDRLRPRVEDVTEQPLPEISESMRKRYFVLGFDLVPVGGGQPMRDQRVFHFRDDQPVEWKSLQPGVFKFGFFQRQPEEDGAFVMELWSTVIVAVSTPWPGLRGALLKGRKNPFSREAGCPPRKTRTDRPSQGELPL